MTVRKFWLSAAAVLAATALWVGIAFWKAARAARNASANVAASQIANFTSCPLDRALPAVEPIGSPAAFTDVAQFANSTFVSTPSALVEYDDAASVRNRWRAGMELPPAVLGRLAVATVAGANGPELWLATDGAGLVAFDGHSFRQILPTDPLARKITALLPLDTGRLLLGTAGHGVFYFDGQTLAPFDAALTGVRVTELAGNSANIWIGTADRGVYHWQAGTLSHFGEPEGLPDPNVTSLLVSGASAFAGGPVGIAEFRDGRLYRTLARGFFTSALAFAGETLVAGSLEEGIAAIPLAPRVPRMVHSSTSRPAGAVQRLVNVPGAILAVTSEGLYATSTGETAWKQVTGAEPSKLADRNISALAFDFAGRLWVGYFDRGLDVLDWNRATHFENDALYCINRIVENPAQHTTAVATANGLVIFDNRPTERQVMRRAQGLIADDVTDIALRGSGMALATPAGITLVDDSGTHSVSDFHGLVNQHVYTLAQDDNRLLAGTLGGLSVLEGGVVRASYTTFNSRLRHNWITAIRRVGGDWFVGTYGAGVVRFSRNGDWDAFPDLRGSIVINSNAMLVTPTRVYAGTMENGLAIFDRPTARWHFSTDGLPSLNVTALATGGGAIYIGTDNGLVRATEQNLR